MKKIFLIAAIAACTSLTIKAQTISGGVKGGLNLAKLSNTDNSNVRPSIYLGGFVNIAFNESLSIQPELFYSGQGDKFTVLNAKFTDKINYINLPVMMQYHIVPEFYLEAGAQFGIMVSSKTKSGDVTVNMKDATSTGDFGLGFGLGYQFPIGLGISARYMFGLTDVYKHGDDVITLDDIHNKNAVAQIGVFYNFGKVVAHKPAKKHHK
jgi:hypothetical protein